MPSARVRQAVETIRRTATTHTDAIDGSYTTGGAPLSATDAGTSATISVIAHGRRYPAESGLGSVSLSSGTITGLGFATDYYVYYDDPTYRSTRTTFLASTDARVAQANYVRGRHPLGPITTPVDGSTAATAGGGTPPPGGGSGGAVLP